MAETHRITLALSDFTLGELADQVMVYVDMYGENAMIINENAEPEIIIVTNDGGEP